MAPHVDYVIAGTVFPTSSKPGRTELLGLSGLASIAAAVRTPVLAIGGIGVEHAGEVSAAGAAGIAVWTDAGVQQLSALPAEPRDVTGAGDALIAGTLFGVTGGLDLAAAARLGLAAAAITVESGATVADNLTVERINARLAANRA